MKNLFKPIEYKGVKIYFSFTCVVEKEKKVCKFGWVVTINEENFGDFITVTDNEILVNGIYEMLLTQSQKGIDNILEKNKK